MSENGILTIVLISVGGLVGIVAMALSFARWYYSKVGIARNAVEALGDDASVLHRDIRELKETVASLAWAIEQQNQPVLRQVDPQESIRP